MAQMDSICTTCGFDFPTDPRPSPLGRSFLKNVAYSPVANILLALCLAILILLAIANLLGAIFLTLSINFVYALNCLLVALISAANAILIARVIDLSPQE